MRTFEASGAQLQCFKNVSLCLLARKMMVGRAVVHSLQNSQEADRVPSTRIIRPSFTLSHNYWFIIKNFPRFGALDVHELLQFYDESI